MHPDNQGESKKAGSAPPECRPFTRFWPSRPCAFKQLACRIAKVCPEKTSAEHFYGSIRGRNGFERFLPLMEEYQSGVKIGYPHSARSRGAYDTSDVHAQQTHPLQYLNKPSTLPEREPGNCPRRQPAHLRCESRADRKNGFQVTDSKRHDTGPTPGSSESPLGPFSPPTHQIHPYQRTQVDSACSTTGSGAPGCHEHLVNHDGPGNLSLASDVGICQFTLSADRNINGSIGASGSVLLVEKIEDLD